MGEGTENKGKRKKWVEGVIKFWTEQKQPLSLLSVHLVPSSICWKHRFKAPPILLSCLISPLPLQQDLESFKAWRVSKLFVPTICHIFPSNNLSFSSPWWGIWSKVWRTILCHFCFFVFFFLCYCHQLSIKRHVISLPCLFVMMNMLTFLGCDSGRDAEYQLSEREFSRKYSLV